VVISRNGPGLTVALPILGAVVLGAQRILPLLQQIYVAWSVSAGNQSLLQQVLEYLALPAKASGSSSAGVRVPFSHMIRLQNVTFTHPGRNRPAVSGATLDIRKGAAVGLIGETGSGKSTLADIIMSLLAPQSGQLLVDGRPLTADDARGWQQMIAHVPQSIFLADSSIASNIALSLPHLPPDDTRIREAAACAHLREFIDTLPDGYDTMVGEGGVRLSGGQRQRLGIARAIYKNSPILVLDEATSALDEITEAAVVANLDALRREGRTIIFVTHRLSMIRRCDAIVRLEDGRIVDTLSPDEIADTSLPAVHH
jgi:ATP-binding cassette subfamily B protein